MPVITLGFDMGGTRIKYGLVQDGTVLCSGVCETPVAQGYAAVVARMADVAEPLLRQADVTAVGVASPGLIDVAQGVVCYSNNFAWQDRPLAADLAARLGRKVRLANDAQCAALGEARYGAGRGCSRMAMLTIGTGVGGGWIRDGQVETDRYGSMAYIFGHAAMAKPGAACNCGRHGCLECYASATAVERQGERVFGTHRSAREIFALARTGDPVARQVVQDFLDALTQGAVNLANVLRPQKIVIGGGVAGSADLILPAVNAGLQRETYGYAYAPVEAVCAQLGDQAGIVGAAALWEPNRKGKENYEAR